MRNSVAKKINKEMNNYVVIKTDMAVKKLSEEKLLSRIRICFNILFRIKYDMNFRIEKPTMPKGYMKNKGWKKKGEE